VPDDVYFPDYPMKLPKISAPGLRWSQASPGTPASAIVSIDYVSVGNAGNAADTVTPNPGYGAVAYDYNIGKYEVTNAQYAQ
jgi:hypothetical protein